MLIASTTTTVTTLLHISQTGCGYDMNMWIFGEQGECTQVVSYTQTLIHMPGHFALFG